ACQHRIKGRRRLPGARRVGANHATPLDRSAMYHRAAVRRPFDSYRPSKGLLLLDFSSAVVLGVLEPAFPIAVQRFIDGLLPSGQWRLITLAALGLALVYLLNTALTFVVTYWGHMLGINIETDMRRKAFDHMLRLSFRYYDEQKTGHLVG